MKQLSLLIKSLPVFLSQRRLIVRIIVIAAIPFILTRPAILEPLLNLWLAGLVPGTDYMLSPDFILGALAIAACLTVMTVVLRWLWRRSKRIGEYTAAWAAGDAAVTMELGAEHVIYDRPTEQVQKVPRRSLREFVETAEDMVVLAADRISRAAVYGYRAVRSVVRETIRLMRRALLGYLSLLLRLAVLTIVTARYVGALARYYAIRSWRWARPRLYALDIWLERWTLAVSAWAGHRLKRYETVQVGMEIFRQGKLSVKRLFQK